MKKLHFLVPVAGWIGIYFFWSFSARFIGDVMTVSAFWWLLTDVAAVYVWAKSVGWAFDKQD